MYLYMCIDEYKIQIYISEVIKCMFSSSDRLPFGNFISSKYKKICFVKSLFPSAN